MIDVDAFEERAAIQEYDGGLSRFQAETEAAKAQGLTRWEALHEIGRRLVERTRDQRSVAGQPRQNDVPRVQPHAEEKARPVPERESGR